MKNTKRLLTWILVAVMIVLTVALVACVPKPQPVQLTDLELPKLKDNQMAVIIKNGDNDYTSYVVTLGKGGTDAKTCEGVLDYLVEEAGLTLECTGSGSSKMISKIGGIDPNPNAANYEYVQIFTNNPNFFDNSAWGSEIKVGEAVFKSSSKGIHELKVVAGDIIYFQLGVYAG